MRALSLLLLLVACATKSDDPVDSSIALAPDADGDGYNEELDCDDDDATVYPNADELCDDLDNDCDGDTDEDPVDATLWYGDVDRDGYGDPEDDGLASCTQSTGLVANNGDCDDGDAGRNPAEPEVCGDGLDNNCDGEVDEDGAVDTVAWYFDADGDGYGDPDAVTWACALPDGYVSNADDCLDVADDSGGLDPATYYPGAPEFCDGTDHDCDGEVYEDDGSGTNIWYLDRDGDGYGGHTASVKSCDDPSAGTRLYAQNDDDCDDTDDGVNPAAEELCDGDDNDCDGSVDDGLKVYSYRDADGDGYGDPDTRSYTCPDARPSGYVENDEDCEDSGDDESAAEIYPGAPEYCNGYDDDCDGDVDEAGSLDEETWYLDADVDGYGDSASSVDGCEAPTGYVADDSDCDDASDATNPGTRERCDGADNDCDGDVDEGRASDGTRYYLDEDGDGYGVSTSWTVTCEEPSGYAAFGTDCDDGDPEVSPAATEVCDDVDNDCDDEIDEDSAADATTWYRDSDLDGYGDPAVSTTTCDRPAGYVANSTDCDDTTATLTTACD